MLTRAEVEEALRGYDPSVFPRWWATLNCWDWPEDCPIPCPAHYVTDPENETGKMAKVRALWMYLKDQTTREERSRAWWIYALGRTEAQWQAYWDSPDCFERSLWYRMLES